MEGSFIPNNGGTLTVRDSTIYNNTNSTEVGDSGFEGDGGAIYNGGGTLTVSDSTFISNVAENNGGAIYNSGTLTVSNSTFSFNKIKNSGGLGFDPESGVCHDCGGGAIYNRGTLTVDSSTFFRNRSQQGGGVLNFGTAKLANTIVTESTGANCAGPITDEGFNLSSDTSCGLSTTNNSLPNTDPSSAPSSPTTAVLQRPMPCYPVARP